MGLFHYILPLLLFSSKMSTKDLKTNAATLSTPLTLKVKDNLLERVTGLFPRGIKFSCWKEAPPLTQTQTQSSTPICSSTLENMEMMMEANRTHMM